MELQVTEHRLTDESLSLDAAPRIVYRIEGNRRSTPPGR